MKFLPMALFAGAVAVSAIALAADEKFAAVDQNGDGLLSLAEVAIAMPDATSEAFDTADADKSGTLTEAEYLAAVDQGILPNS